MVAWVLYGISISSKKIVPHPCGKTKMVELAFFGKKCKTYRDDRDVLEEEMGKIDEYVAS